MTDRDREREGGLHNYTDQQKDRSTNRHKARSGRVAGGEGWGGGGGGQEGDGGSGGGGGGGNLQ